MALFDQEEKIKNFIWFIVLFFYVAFFFIPVGMVFAQVFQVGFVLPSLQELLQWTWNSLFISLLSTFLAAGVGCGLAFWVAEGQHSPRWVGIFSYPLALPSLLVSLILVGTFGVYIFGLQGILLAHTLLNYPIFLSTVYLQLKWSDRFDEWTALSLGASRREVFFQIGFRKLIPPLRSAGVLSFLYCLGSVVILLLLGGTWAESTLEVAIYQAIKIELDLPLAIALSIFQAFIALLFFGFVYRVWSIRNLIQNDSFPLYYPKSKSAHFLFTGVVFLVPAVCFFATVRFILDSFWNIFQVQSGELLTLIGNTLLLAVIAGILSNIIALLCLVRRKQDGYLQLLPIALSPFFLSFAYFLLFNPWDGFVRIFILSIFQSIFFIPLILPFYRARLSRVPQDWFWIAQNLGATPFQRMRWLLFPFLKGTLQKGFFVAVSLSIGEVTSQILLAPSGWNSISLSILRKFQQYRFPEAFGLSALLIVFLILFGVLAQRGERAHGALD